MARQRTKLSLHIVHPTRDLSSACGSLGLVPKYVWKKGEERRTPKGKKIGGVQEYSYCSIELGPISSEPLPKKIQAALDRLQPHRSILRRLAHTGGKVSFFVGWFCDEHTGERFDALLLGRMASLRIGFDLSIYVPDRPASRKAGPRSRK